MSVNLLVLQIHRLQVLFNNVSPVSMHVLQVCKDQLAQHIKIQNLFLGPPVSFGETSILAIRLLQCQSPCQQGLFLPKANVQIATVDSQVLVTDSPVPSRKNKWVRWLPAVSLQWTCWQYACERSDSDQVADLATINFKVCQLLFCSSVLAMAITLAS